MENLNRIQLYKYQVTVNFYMDDEFLSFVPTHRVYINRLIKKMIDKNLFYVFVNLITKDKLPEFYIVPSKVIAKLLLQIIKNGWK